MTRTPKPSPGRRRRAARIAAAQALYQIALTGADAEAVLGEFAGTAFGAGEDGPAGIEERLFEDIVRGAAGRQLEIDEAVNGALDKERSLDRLEILIVAILRAGTYELLGRPDIDPPLTINEYVEVTNAFFYGREPAFVNGILDRLARRLRPQEMSSRKAGQISVPTPELSHDDSSQER